MAAGRRRRPELPHNGSAFPELAEEPAGYEKSSGALRFPVDQPLPPKPVEKLIAVQLQQAFPQIPGNRMDRSGTLCEANLPKASSRHLVLVRRLGVAARRRIEDQEKEDPMSSTETGSGSTDRFIESFHDAGNASLEAVRKFLDTVNGVFPDASADDGPRQKIIDSAFKMTEQLVGTSTQLAKKIVTGSRDILDEANKEG